MSVRRRKVLFVCLGNSCRSQMAEGFARTYGADVMLAASAGVFPAYGIAEDTIRAMDEKNIDIREQSPKGLEQFAGTKFDLVVNMSGFGIPEGLRTTVREWDVRDPIDGNFTVHRQVRDEIEERVKDLILELREAKNHQSARQHK